MHLLVTTIVRLNVRTRRSEHWQRLQAMHVRVPKQVAAAEAHNAVRALVRPLLKADRARRGLHEETVASDAMS